MMETHQYHHQRLQGDSELIIWLFIAHCTAILFNLLPTEYETHKMFPLSDMLITVKTYAWFLLNYIYVATLYWVIYRLWPIKILKYFFYLQLIIVIDFALSYNSPIFSIFNQSIGIVHLVLTTKAVLILWKQK